MSIVVIKPIDSRLSDSLRLDAVLNFALENINYKTINTADQLKDISGKKLLFAIDLGDDGINLEYIKILSKIRSNIDIFNGCTAGIIVNGNGPLYTKSVASELVFAANISGCAF